ncbi:DUF58 domain-containing protein [Thermodesulfovibrio sp. 3907-1M]|uniref:DUF58 domain-containing protein n=1 Tax=Thermodesulfovibrio autotrophicus TaxID=3118333 RepID=A0AAU8H0E3_9BACT
MALSGIVSFFNLKNIEISILPPEDIFALKPASFRIRAKNKYFFGVFLLRIKVFNEEKIISYLKGEKNLIVNLTFSKRGIHTIKEIIVSSYFPFYFFKRTRTLPLKFEFTVFPYPLKCDISFLISEGKAKVDSIISKGKSYEGEVTGVRAYTHGDPIKYIHWKATAKTSSLKTKEFSPPSGNPVVVNLSDFSGNIEEKISKTAYALIELTKMGNPAGLKLNNEFYPPETGHSHLRRMLYALAVYNSK